MVPGTLSESAQAALAVLGTSEIIRKCYLAGGSALALQLGHRMSYDFDFFTREKLQAQAIATHLADLGAFTTTLLEPPHTVMGEFDGVKFSLFRYDYPLIGKTVVFGGVTLASIEDIAAMKLSAIGGRATKRDYIDIYVISRQIPLDSQFELFEKKFGVLGNNRYITIKALGYFDDAEGDDIPRILDTSVTWEKVKDFLAHESMRLAKIAF